MTDIVKNAIPKYTTTLSSVTKKFLAFYYYFFYPKLTVNFSADQSKVSVLQSLKVTCYLTLAPLWGCWDGGTDLPIVRGGSELEGWAPHTPLKKIFKDLKIASKKH